MFYDFISILSFNLFINAVNDKHQATVIDLHESILKVILLYRTVPVLSYHQMDKVIQLVYLKYIYMIFIYM